VFVQGGQGNCGVWVQNKKVHFVQLVCGPDKSLFFLWYLSQV
jgi:hypothetical protein